MVWKMIFVVKGVIFRFHVIFWGSSWNEVISSPFPVFVGEEWLLRAAYEQQDPLDVSAH